MTETLSSLASELSLAESSHQVCDMFLKFFRELIVRRSISLEIFLSDEPGEGDFPVEARPSWADRSGARSIARGQARRADPGDSRSTFAAGGTNELFFAARRP
jgi:hypothetical protein